MAKSNDFNLIDKTGEWMINRSPFRLAHNRSANPDVPELVYLESGVPTKIVMDDFLKSQPTIESCPDPMSDEAMPAVIVPVENTLVPLDASTGDPSAANAPGVLGTKSETTVTGNKPSGPKK